MAHSMNVDTNVDTKSDPKNLYYIGIASPYDNQVAKDGDKYVGLSYTPKNMDDLSDVCSDLRQRNIYADAVDEHTSDAPVGRILMLWRTNKNELGVIGKISGEYEASKDLINKMVDGKQLGLSIGGLGVYDPNTAKMKIKGIRHIGHVEEPLFGAEGTWVKEFSEDPAVIFDLFTSKYFNNAAYINDRDKITLQNWMRISGKNDNINNSISLIPSNNKLNNNNNNFLTAELSSYFGLNTSNTSASINSAVSNNNLPGSSYRNNDYNNTGENRTNTSNNNKSPVLFITQYSGNKYNFPVIRFDFSKLLNMSGNDKTATTLPTITSPPQVTDAAPVIATSQPPVQQVTIPPQQSLVNTQLPTTTVTTFTTQQVGATSIAPKQKDDNSMDVDDVGSVGGNRNIKRKAVDQIPPAATHIVDPSINAADLLARTSGMKIEEAATAITFAKKMRDNAYGVKSEEEILALMDRGRKFDQIEAERKKAELDERKKQIELAKNAYAESYGAALSKDQRDYMNTIFANAESNEDLSKVLLITTTAHKNLINTQQSLQQNQINVMQTEHALRAAFQQQSSSTPINNSAAQQYPQVQNVPPRDYFSSNNQPLQQQQPVGAKKPQCALDGMLNFFIKENKDIKESIGWVNSFNKIFYPQSGQLPPQDDKLSGQLDHLFATRGSLTRGITTHTTPYDQYLNKDVTGYSQRGGFALTQQALGTIPEMPGYYSVPIPDINNRFN